MTKEKRKPKTKSLWKVLEEIQKASRPFWDERHRIEQAECPQRIEALRAMHVNVDEIGGNCPVQAEGTVKGQSFYFRARGDKWSLEIGPKRDWHTDRIWRYERPYGTWPDAGWMHNHEALDFIKEGVEAWMEERKK